MGISERKRKQTEELRERVLDAAEDIFANEGVNQVTMRRIASSVDYAPTVLYRLFDNKDDLMDHLIARGYGGVRSRYEDVLANTQATPLQTLSAILEAYTSYALSHPNHYHMWFETSTIRLEKGELKMSHGRLEFVVFEVWTDAIEACRKDGQFSGLKKYDVFQVLWARLHGLISLRLQNPEFPWLPVDRHLAQVLDLVNLARG